MLTVLQLDTGFPRIPGDVAAPATYNAPIDVIRIPKATVSKAVNHRPDEMDITAFEDAVGNVKDGMIVTSCGFLGYWQDHLARISNVPIITSSLCLLPGLLNKYAPEDIGIITFNAATLKSAAYAKLLEGFTGPIIGLTPDMHLRQVIEEDADRLDHQRAEAELTNHLAPSINGLKAILLECTNLPPYKAAIFKEFNGHIYDILSAIEEVMPGQVKRQFAS